MIEAHLLVALFLVNDYGLFEQFSQVHNQFEFHPQQILYLTILLFFMPIGSLTNSYVIPMNHSLYFFACISRT